MKGVSGYALPGQTLYIMGASGAGKTTLLNALSGRIKETDGAILTGERKLSNRIDLNKEIFSKFGSFSRGNFFMKTAALISCRVVKLKGPVVH